MLLHGSTFKTFVSWELNRARMTIRNPDLFWGGNQFIQDRNNKRLGINLLVKSCGINLKLCNQFGSLFLVILINT
jgi:hypothetical protein